MTSESPWRYAVFSPKTHWDTLKEDLRAVASLLEEANPRAWPELRAAQIRLRGQAAEPGSWKAYALCGEANLCLGRAAECFTAFRRARAAVGSWEEGDALAWEGEMLLWTGKDARALSLLDRAHEAGGKYALAWRGATKLRLGRAREALKDLIGALERVPDDLEANIWLAETRRALGLHYESLEGLHAMSPWHPDDDEAAVWPWNHMNRALACDALGDVVEMGRSFERIPGFIVRYLRKAAGLPADGRLGRTQTRVLLEKGLAVARGYRRPEAYGHAVWMGVDALGAGS